MAEEIKKQQEKSHHCLRCNRDLVKDNFYLSNSILYENNGSRISVCKKCIVDLYDELFEVYGDTTFCVFVICRLLDAYFDSTLVQPSQIQATNGNSSIIKIYFQKINSLKQYANYTFKDSTDLDLRLPGNFTESEFVEFNEPDRKNRDEVVELCGFDPFEDSNPSEKPYLYNTILSYLDEGTIRDSFKLSAVISIVKMFSQTEMIDRIIDSITRDTDALEQNAAKLKQLIDIKKSLQSQIVSYAKENGITTAKGTNQNKGSGTFSGIIAELRDKKVRPADVNLFNIQTSDAFSKIAEISNKNILRQLQLDENDYSKMVAQQREKLQEYRSKTEELEEENRQLKKELQLLKDGIK